MHLLSHQPETAAAQPALKPVIILVHGAWHNPDCWYKVKLRLEAAGYEVYTPRLLTVVGGKPVSYSWRADVAVVHDVAIPLFQQGRQAVIVGHSYGGLVTTASVEGQSVADRQSRGLQGGFSAVVFLCAFLMTQRGSIIRALAGKYRDWMIPPEPNDKDTPSSIKVARELAPFYNDLPQDEAEKWQGKLLDQSHRSFEEPIEFSANEIKIPMTYLLCEADKAVPIRDQELMTGAVPAVKTRRCTAGHSPFLSQPDLTADFIIEAARDS
ncbi:hypothetical protein NUW58_g2963 [Xylaria curta]|uniref:Uncharacterized protein n=1 Tax=Xylaria curta TaxID=42375 RepID=A0ACC1PD51_9PEZI|nr:hypothetical protein NUW58_g2963 [Xylaria curta]